MPSLVHDALRDVPILVTGASGFIGGRLTERLASEEGARVDGTGRSFREEARLRSAGVTLCPADVRDRTAMERLCHGKQIVVHLAAWVQRGRGGEADAYAINIDATRVLIEAAAAAGVRRFVLVSTVAAYGLPVVDDIDESVPLDTHQGDLYGRTKALGEQAAEEAAARAGLSLTILRPAMVIGPGSPGWTTGMLRLVQRGVPVLYGKSGFAYPVYIDDVVDAILLAATRPEATGQAFNVSGPSVEWATFFGHYGRMLGKSPRRVPMAVARAIAWANETFKLGIPLTTLRLRTYVRRLRYPTQKAEQLLGWKPRVSLDEGMRRSEAWLREEGLLRT
ncbi:NAD-dependent epimerase/dehydratase family protein [Chondromyces apiculatus]|uniref:Oxidoreductase n=1 Tax=Chondromyces apiculatus DSM 436 TaxID=1192034 RepID=A0A017T265_9BACT|nr:NAD(P)-dependent oxidoreductase [Chondromyces apiculatus]EYF03338.1 oxidoreductase [Chondromyces apiculatus DSM 436]